MREGNLIAVGIAEPFIPGQDFMQPRRATPPMTQNKQRRENSDRLDPKVESPPFQSHPKTITEALHADCQSAWSALHIHGSASSLQKPEPSPKRDASQQPRSAERQQFSAPFRIGGHIIPFRSMRFVEKGFHPPPHTFTAAWILRVNAAATNNRPPATAKEEVKLPPLCAVSICCRRLKTNPPTPQAVKRIP